MSKNFSVNNSFNCFVSEEKKHLNELWVYFMTAFNYRNYYNLNNKKYLNDSNNINNDFYDEPFLKSIAIKKLNNFFKSKELVILTNGNLSIKNKKFNKILNETKLWIMYIIITKENSKNDVQKIINLFQFAIKKNCDVISLFEFYLIYVSEINKNLFDNVKNILVIDEFKNLFKNNKKLLYEIFSVKNGNNNNNNYNNDYNIFKTPKNKNFYEYENNNNNNNNNEFEINDEIFNDEENNSVNEENNNNNNENEEENNELILINKDYLNKGLFCLFTKSKNIENLETLNYILTPLKPEFKGFEEKEEVKNLLNILKKTIYSNFEYHPFNSKYLSLLSNK